jgi:hypothetical protein
MKGAGMNCAGMNCADRTSANTNSEPPDNRLRIRLGFEPTSDF